MAGTWSSSPSLSFHLSVQEFFFTPFAARGRVSWWTGRESNLFKTPKIPRPCLKCPEWLSTQGCPRDEKRRGKTGADLDCPRCVCAGGGHTHPHAQMCRGLLPSCLSVCTQARVYKLLSQGWELCGGDQRKFSFPFWLWTCNWRWQLVNFQAVLGQRVSFFPGPAWKSRGSSDIRRDSSGPVQGSSSAWTSVRM